MARKGKRPAVTQVPKHRKRPRAWHHGPGEDAKFERAMRLLQGALAKEVVIT